MVWSPDLLPYEDEIRSVEGRRLQARAAPKEPPQQLRKPTQLHSGTGMSVPYISLISA